MKLRRLLSLGIIILSGTSAARGQEVAPAASQSSAGGTYTIQDLFGPGQVPSLNWSDIPVKLTINQSAGYNDNILGLPNGATTPFGARRGDLFSTTSVGLATKAWAGGEQFFVDGNYGVTRYLNDVAFDTSRYLVDTGVNWSVGSTCAGSFIASATQYQSPVEEQLQPGINTVRTQSVSNTSKCPLMGNLSALFDSGWLRSQNSQVLTALNNYDSVFARGGFEYAVSSLDTLRATTTFTRRDFPNRVNGAGAGFSTFGLVDKVDQVDYQLQYHRVFSPKLSFDGAAGAAEIISHVAPPSPGTAQRLAPTYSASLLWRWSPNLSVGLTGARTVGAPTSILANAQIYETQTLQLTYQLSPKTSLQAGVTHSRSTGSVALQDTGFDIFASVAALTLSAGLSYAITPFLGATASIQHSDRSFPGFSVNSNIVTVGLAYRPQ